MHVCTCTRHACVELVTDWSSPTTIMPSASLEQKQRRKADTCEYFPDGPACLPRTRSTIAVVLVRRGYLLCLPRRHLPCVCYAFAPSRRLVAAGGNRYASPSSPHSSPGREGYYCAQCAFLSQRARGRAPNEARRSAKGVNPQDLLPPRSIERFHGTRR